jgi:type IX secretion system PorP/SprF family membrane protein
MTFPVNPRKGASHFGVGLVATGDQAGDGRLRTTEVGVQSAFHQQLSRGGKSMLSAGFAASVGSKSVDADRLIFNNQWTETGFDPTLPNGESFSGLREGYLDLSAGLGFFARTSLHNYVFLDASLHHLNQPRISFLDARQALGLRPVLAAGGRFSLRGTTAVLPRVQFSSEQNARQLIAGANFSWGLDYTWDGNQLIGGLWYRYGDAVIVNVGTRLNDLQLMLSYDLNASGLTPASNGYGAVEFSLVYVGRKKDRKLECPNNF